MLDATRGIEGQDWNIFSLIQRNQKGLVVVVNKWDLVEDKTDKVIKHYEEAISDLNHALSLDSNTDVTDLMMKLIESVPTDELAEKVTNVIGLMSLK